jgi:hypothetical protein
MENNKRRKVTVSVSTEIIFNSSTISLLTSPFVPPSFAINMYTTIYIAGKYSSEGQNKKRRIFIASTKQYTIKIILSLEFSSGVWNNLLMADI